jgi:hypothetical protein
MCVLHVCACVYCMCVYVCIACVCLCVLHVCACVYCMAGGGGPDDATSVSRQEVKPHDVLHSLLPAHADPSKAVILHYARKR